MKNYINRILQCCYICKDYDNMKTFYSEILELKKTKSDKFTREIIDYFKSRGFICNHQPGDEYMSCFSVADEESIVLLNIQYEGENETNNQGFFHVCLMVEDIIQTARELESKGIQIWEGPSYENPPYNEPYNADVPQPCHSLVFFIQDPEGNEIEIMQFTDESLQVLHDFE